MANILVLHGPNLNLLGTREANIYGNITIETINTQLSQQANKLGHQIQCLQSNAEHELVSYIQKAQGKTDIIIINPAAYTHTSIALRDAFLAVNIPFIEAHLSNIKAREPFRHHSFLADIAIGCIFGFGAYSYELALNAAHRYLTTKQS